MPRIGLSLTLAALLIAAAAFAQGPAAPGQPLQVPGQPASRVPVPGAGGPAAAPAIQPAPAAVDPKLKAHLEAWEATMKASTNFYSPKCTVVRKNLLRKTEKPSIGDVMCMKPNLALMRLDPVLPAGAKANPNDYEAYICSGKAIYEYDASNKTVNEYPLPANGASGNLLLDFLSGAITANGAMQRFDMKVTKEEANYVHLEMRPTLPADKVDFEVMTVVLFGPSVPKPYVAYLPCVVIMRKNNGQEEEMWSFPQPQVNVKMEAKTFEPVFPQGWKHVKQQPKPVAGGPPLGPPK